MDSDASDDTLSGRDSIECELEVGRTNAEVDVELETLKVEVDESFGSSSSKSASVNDADVGVETDVTDERVEAELKEPRNEDDFSSS